MGAVSSKGQYMYPRSIFNGNILPQFSSRYIAANLALVIVKPCIDPVNVHHCIKPSSLAAEYLVESNCFIWDISPSTSQLTDKASLLI